MAAKLHKGNTTGSRDIQNGWILSGQPSYILSGVQLPTFPCTVVGLTEGSLQVLSNSWLRLSLRILLLLLPLALQPTLGFGLSNNVLPFFPICHQPSPSSHSQHLKISFYFLFPSFPGYSPSSRPFLFFSEDLFGHPVLLHSLQVT